MAKKKTKPKASQRMVLPKKQPLPKGSGEMASEMGKKDYVAKYISENGYMPMEAWYDSEDI
jgi:hypothetical protein